MMALENVDMHQPRTSDRSHPTDDEIMKVAAATWAVYEHRPGLQYLDIGNDTMEIIGIRQYGPSKCLIASSGGKLYIALRGSQTWEDWQANLSLGYQPLAGGGNAHLGFHRRAAALPLGALLEEFRPLGFAPADVLVCGHSQGGAVAQLALALLLLEDPANAQIYAGVRAVGVGAPFFADAGLAARLAAAGADRALFSVAAASDAVPGALNVGRSVPALVERAEDLERRAVGALRWLGLVSGEGAARYRAAADGAGRRALKAAVAAAAQSSVLARPYVPVGAYKVFDPWAWRGGCAAGRGGWAQQAEGADLEQEEEEGGGRRGGEEGEPAAWRRLAGLYWLPAREAEEALNRGVKELGLTSILGHLARNYVGFFGGDELLCSLEAQRAVLKRSARDHAYEAEASC